MTLAELQSAVAAHMRERGADLGLDSDRVDVAYVLNRGGFVNHSFRISDGQRRLHLKLASEAGSHEALGRWRDLGDALAPYHAPPIVAWVELADGALVGPVTEWIDGRLPERISPELAGRVVPVIARLHADARIAAYLAPEGEGMSCADSYLTTYGERFAEDLEHIARYRPRFVTEAALRLMRDEAARLDRVVRRSAAFREPARSPVHADLWTDNLLVTEGGEWYLLDWDELRIGDPILDVAMLLGPSAADMRPVEGAGDPYLHTDAERERFALHTRARLLDWAIDSLADWIEADTAPEHAAEVRAEKRSLHAEALELYSAVYLT